LRKVCDHPKLVLDATHPEWAAVERVLAQTNTTLDDIGHAAKLPALQDLLLQCGIGANDESGSSSAATNVVASQHRALVFFQLKVDTMHTAHARYLFI
jgi:TATA-binding protein-associated factor